MWVVPFALLLVAAPPAQAPDDRDPAAIFRLAAAAVEGDSVAAVERRWSTRRRRDSTDRVAALGLAVLAHLTYRDSLAERLYRVAMSGAGGDARAARAAGYAAVALVRLIAQRGHWLRADTVAQLAVAAGRATGDSSLLGQALVARGGIHMRTRGDAAGLALVAEGIAVLPERDLRARALAKCLGAQALSRRGDPTALEEALTGSRIAAADGDAAGRGRCLTVAAAEYGRQGWSDSALAHYAHAVAAFRTARDRAGLALALQWRSHLDQQRGRLGAARRDAEEAIVEAEGAGVPQVIPWARSTAARVAFALGDVPGAEAQASLASREFVAQGDRYGILAARSLEGQLALTLGEAAAARAAYRDVATRARAGRWPDFEVTAHWSLAELALRENDLDGARAELDTARRLARAHGFFGREQALGYFDGVVALRAARWGEAERLFRDGAAATRADQPSWRYLYQARLAEVHARRGELPDAERLLVESAIALDAWREQLSDRDLKLLAFQLAEDRADPDLGVATVIAALAGANRLAAAFEVAERGRARELADQLNRAAALDTAGGERAARADSPATLAGLIRALPDDSTALLEYVTGRGDPTTLFVVTRRGARAYVLAPQDSMARRIARLLVLLESGDDPRALGRELGTALLHPALAELDPGVRRLVVVSDGPLHRLPFDVLVLPDGRFVVERFAVAGVPSAGVAAHLWGRPPRAAAPAGLVVFADPRFANETGASAGSADVFRSARGGRGGLPRLRASGREARAIARYAEEATVLRRAEASEAWLKRAPLATYGLVHFATHALVDEGSVAGTALALAPTDDEDGFVGPGELAALTLRAELVVLSACRTAGGTVVRGEGIQGLAAPLLAAGARAVAATWWPIGDEATVRQVEDFYQGMAGGQPAAEALRAAKLAALARGALARDWAAFTIVGDPLARPRLRPPPRARFALPAIAAGIAAGLALLAYGAMRRRRASERG